MAKKNDINLDEFLSEAQVNVKRTKAGRPPKIKTKDLIAAAYDYMETASLPNITEFALMMGYERQYLYERAKNEEEQGKGELSDTIKKISQLKEVKLEKYAMLGLCPANFAIFALKQLGWSDKVEQKVETNSDSCGVIILPPRLEDNDE